MASTNKTTHYLLSQYVGTDKPTYLTDYNQDMDKIDDGIYAAKSLADVNSNSIGDLTTLSTTVKSNVVGAINEVNTQVGTNTSNIATNTSNIATNTSNIATNTTSIGTLANLDTTTKTSLVGAVNEVVGNIGDLSSLSTTIKSDIVNAINEVLSDFNLNIFDLPTNVTTSTGSISVEQLNTARNNKGTIGKIYGALDITNIPLNSSVLNVTMQTPFRPADDITIQCTVFSRQYGTNTSTVSIISSFNLSSLGELSMSLSLYPTTTTVEFRLIPCLLFIKDFGDVPTI